MKVLVLGHSAPSDDVLSNAAQLAAVTLDVFRTASAADASPLETYDLVIADEHAVALLDQTSDGVPASRPSRMLVTSNGSIGEASASLLRRGRAQCANRNDTAAIATVLRSSHQTSPGAVDDDALERSVRERTRELEASHQRLRLSERIAAMGTLATGIGHDIGNLVLPLRIALEALESRTLPKGCEPDLQAIRKSIEYLQGLANGLRYLAMDPHDVGLTARHVDVSEWWEDVEPLLRNCLPREVALMREFLPDLPYVAVPTHHLTQIIFNLVQNAGEAMRRHGKGTICVRVEAANDRKDVRLSVIDDGPGMSAEVRDRCIEPFFTTKFRSVHTGLGLPLVHGLVHQAQGEIQLESEEGRGTRWIITLPAKERSERLQPGQRPVARVDLSDNRMHAYVTSVLTSLDFEVSEHGGYEGTGRTSLCITEADSPLARMAGTLLEDDEHLHIVVFGASENGHDRLHALGTKPPSAAVRATLRDIRAVI